MPHTWKLGTEGDALPILSTISGVKQNSWLADNPTLVPAEADRVEAVVKSLVDSI